MLIGLYLLTPILRRFIKNSSREYIEYFLLLVFLAGACLPLFNKILEQIPFFNGRTLYFPLPEVSGYAGYFVAGYYFTRYDIKKKVKTGIYIAAAVSLILTLLGTSLISLYTKTANQYLVGAMLPNNMIITFAVFLVFKYEVSKIKFSAQQRGIIIALAKNMLGVYIIHVFVIETFDILGLHSLIMNPVLAIPLLSILVMIVSNIGVAIMRRIPLVNKFV
jgi:surface polysaccharide O-acyltransferase-like enzyme